MAIDSSPLEGAGRVEDTINLLAHAGRKVAECAAGLLEWPAERVCREARAPLLAASSVKKALDLNWSDPAQKASAVKSLAIQLENLKDWIGAQLSAEMKKPPRDASTATSATSRPTSTATSSWPARSRRRTGPRTRLRRS